MYRIGENHIKRHHRRMALLGIAVIIAVTASILGVRSLRASTIISPAPPATVSTLATPTVPTKHIDEPLFGIDLPEDWKLQSHNTSAANIYTWTNTAGNAGVRLLSLYLDTPQPGLGVNHAIAVQSSTDHLTVTSGVSDNCSGFTGSSVGAPSNAVPAKWKGMDFLCDLANYERDVVGIVAQDGINKVVLTGATVGSHSVFFAYTDNSNQPDYTIFQNALQSFRLK